MKELTSRQKEIIDYIEIFINKNKIPPSVYEIAGHFKCTNATIFNHLLALQRKGYLERSEKARSIVLLKKIETSFIENIIRKIPIIGRISAGAPLMAEEHIENEMDFDTSVLTDSTRMAKLFGLKINGDSMQEIGIFDGDILIAKESHNARSGDVVIAMIDGSTTVKSIFFHSDKVELRPANKEYQSQFYPKELVQIQGTAVALQRVF